MPANSVLNESYLLSERDRTALTRLKGTIRGGHAIAFVGAGLSARAGFADWDRLLAMLSGREAKQPRQAPSTEDLPWWADRARERLSERTYHAKLKQFFGRKPKNDGAVEDFARLPFAHVFTTNYDRSIEVALKRVKGSRTTLDWRDPPSSASILEKFHADSPDSRCLVYLHGRYDNPSRIVLSERDYQDAYVRSDETSRRLFALFSLRPVVFVGFSLRDLDVLAVFRQVRAVNGSVRNFAILQKPDTGVTNLRMRLRNRYGIEPVFYEPGGASHPNFARLMSELVGRKWTAPREKVDKKQTSTTRANTWASRPEFARDRAAVDPDDPQKGRFGGRAIRNGRRITAKVTPVRGDPDWFTVQVEVKPYGRNAAPIKGSKVDFWVHDSFPQEHYYVFVGKDGVAKYSFTAYGAFTIGATCDNGSTPLELDLSRISSAPKTFRTR
jgi:hypothetical protein